MDAASLVSNGADRSTMARSILLLAVRRRGVDVTADSQKYKLQAEEPASFFNDRTTGVVLEEAAKFAQKAGCRFAVVSGSVPQSAQLALYVEFFAQLLNTPPLPDALYTVVSTASNQFVINKR